MGADAWQDDAPNEDYHRASGGTRHSWADAKPWVEDYHDNVSGAEEARIIRTGSRTSRTTTRMIVRQASGKGPGKAVRSGRSRPAVGREFFG
jgi:hypothetical protein